MNPIEKLEKTSLIVASAIHGNRPQDLLKEEHLERVALYSPALLENKYGFTRSTPLMLRSRTAPSRP
jgi:hypothetical protein